AKRIGLINGPSWRPRQQARGLAVALARALGLGQRVRQRTAAPPSPCPAVARLLLTEIIISSSRRVAPRKVALTNSTAANAGRWNAPLAQECPPLGALPGTGSKNLSGPSCEFSSSSPTCSCSFSGLIEF